MERGDSFGGFRQPVHCPRVRYALSKSDVWDINKEYSCPAGFHWATEQEYYAYVNGN